MNFIIEYLFPIMDDLDHPTWIEEWKNLYAAAFEKKSKPRCKLTIN